MRKNIIEAVDSAVDAAKKLQEEKAIVFIEKAALLIAQTFQKKGKLLIAGNGGSLCDAMHFAEELTGQFREKRKALAAIALSDPGHLTCTGNDMGFDDVFARSVEALGKKEDLLVLLTTSGNSENIYRAYCAAKEIGLSTLAFLGKSGGKLAGLSDVEWIVDGFSTSDRIQEAHMAAIHIIIEMVEKKLFYYSLLQKKLHA